MDEHTNTATPPSPTSNHNLRAATTIEAPGDEVHRKYERDEVGGGCQEPVRSQDGPIKQIESAFLLWQKNGKNEKVSTYGRFVRVEEFERILESPNRLNVSGHLICGILAYRVTTLSTSHWTWRTSMPRAHDQMSNRDLTGVMTLSMINSATGPIFFSAVFLYCACSVWNLFAWVVLVIGAWFTHSCGRRTVHGNGKWRRRVFHTTRQFLYVKAMWSSIGANIRCGVFFCLLRCCWKSHRIAFCVGLFAVQIAQFVLILRVSFVQRSSWCWWNFVVSK